MAKKNDPHILHLPETAVEQILSFLSFDEIARNRIVCSKFNEIGGNCLNRGYYRLVKNHAAIFKSLKSKLPRRESERRAHPLWRQYDIMAAVETRINILNMTYVKYMESSACCFIPGKIIDEIQNIICLIDRNPPRPQETLKELRDISSMAMEHFDDFIAPGLRTDVEKNHSESSFNRNSDESTGNVTTMLISRVFNYVRKLTSANKKQQAQLRGITTEMRKLNLRLKNQKRTIRKQQMQIESQNKRLHEQVENLERASVQSTDNCEHKFTQISKELIDVQKNLQQFVAKAPKDKLAFSFAPVNTLPKESVPNTTSTSSLLRSKSIRIMSLLDSSRVVVPRPVISTMMNRKLTSILRKRKPSADVSTDCEKTIKRKRVTFLPIDRSRIRETLDTLVEDTITSNISKNITMSSNFKNTKISNNFNRIWDNKINGPKASRALLDQRVVETSHKNRKRRLTEEIDFK